MDDLTQSLKLENNINLEQKIIIKEQNNKVAGFEELTKSLTSQKQYLQTQIEQKDQKLENY
jgi:hypothetical protein